MYGHDVVRDRRSKVVDDSIVGRLRKDILEGVFSPGERLIEVDLAERYGCGRAAIRAALVQLDSEVLVDRKANKGAVLHRISVQEAIEITEARAVLEGLIARRAAEKATAKDAERLNMIVSEMKRAVTEDDPPTYARLNHELHAALMVIGDHAVAAGLVRNLRNRGVQNQYRLAMMPGRQAQSLEQHAAIVDAVVCGDPEQAAAAMGRHLDSVIAVLNRWGDAG